MIAQEYKYRDVPGTYIADYHRFLVHDRKRLSPACIEHAVLKVVLVFPSGKLWRYCEFCFDPLKSRGN